MSRTVFNIPGPALIRKIHDVASPGKYLALDCEMVGVGLEGVESSLARISLVNYHGAVQMDEFVRQRERVVDYRTEYSGIRPSDMETGTAPSLLNSDCVHRH